MLRLCIIYLQTFQNGYLGALKKKKKKHVLTIQVCCYTSYFVDCENDKTPETDIRF